MAHPLVGLVRALRPAVTRLRLGTILLLVLAVAAPALAQEPAEPAFDAQRAWAHLEAIVAFGPRPPGSEAAAAVRAYLTAQFGAVGASVHTQPFAAQTPRGELAMTNLWAELPGTRDEVIVIGAHADTKLLSAVPDFVGANDSASSLAVQLELARALSADPDARPTVWLVCFDGEEAIEQWSDTDGIYGSRAFVAMLQRDGRIARLAAMVNLDMIGDEHLRIIRERQSTPWLVDRVWQIADTLGHGRAFSQAQQHVSDDHVPFLRAGVAAVDLIDFSYGPRSSDNRWWHSRFDTMAHCRPQSLQVVGDVLLRLVRGWMPPPQ